jgi:hypothetical protein
MKPTMKKFLKKVELDTEVVVISFLIMFVGVFLIARAQQAPLFGVAITLLGEQTMNVVYGSEFTDPGATALDSIGNDLTNAIVVTGSVDTFVPGTYTLSYYVTDGEFDDTDIRTVIVDQEIRPTSSGSTARKRALSQQNNILVQEKVELDSSVTSGSGSVSESSGSSKSGSGGESSSDTSRNSKNSDKSTKEETTESSDAVIAEFAEDKAENKFIFEKNLSVGMNNQDVVELQKRLYKEGFFPDTKLSGQFGVATFNAVLRYQIAHLTEIGASTGFVGPATRAVLNQ